MNLIFHNYSLNVTRIQEKGSEWSDPWNTNHCNYNLSGYEVIGIASTAFIFSGIPYAIRHFKLATKDSTRVKGHIFIGCIQLLPVIGAIAALFDFIISKYKSRQEREQRVLFSARKPATLELDPNTTLARKELDLKAAKEQRVLFSAWKPATLDPDTALASMKKTAIHAQKKFLMRNPNSEEISYYATIEEIQKTEEEKERESSSFKYSVTTSEAQGLRPTMQDGHFHIDLDDRFTATGVFDGHGGTKRGPIGQELSKAFIKKFKKIAATKNLKDSTGAETALRMGQLFEETTYAVQQDFLRAHCHDEDAGGSTATVVVIDKQTAQLYSMNIGDSIAQIYRKFSSEQNTKAIVASRPLDWGSAKENKRLANFVEPYYLQSRHGSKCIRAATFDFEDATYSPGGVNLSRAFGDIESRGTKEQPMILDQPTMLVRQLKSGDEVVVSCDGLPDFVSLKDTIKIVDKCKTKGGNLAEQLVNASIANQSPELGGDNVTVISIAVR